MRTDSPFLKANYDINSSSIIVYTMCPTKNAFTLWLPITHIFVVLFQVQITRNNGKVFIYLFIKVNVIFFNLTH